MRHNQKIDPAVAADLESLDAVLAGERKDRELSLIVYEVRASAPPMSPAFAARLDAAADQGFAGPETAARSKRSWRPPLGPALGLGIAGVFALVIGLSANGSNDNNSSSGAGKSLSSASQSSGAASGGASGAASAQSEKAAPTPSAASPVAPSSDAAA